MKTYRQLQKMSKQDLQFYINLNISPFINVKKKKQDLINIIVAILGVKEE